MHAGMFQINQQNKLKFDHPLSFIDVFDTPPCRYFTF